jgi:hypothetical protein
MFWRYLKIQARMLFYGMIGPLFVIMYVLSDNKDSFMQGFLWSGLLVIAVTVVVAVGFTVSGAKSDAQKAALEQTGVLALAQVVGIDETGTRIEDKPLVKLHLQITGPGIQPFRSEDRVLAPTGRMLMINSRNLVALVDPATHEYQIDWERSALVSGVTPAHIGIEEDNQVYDLTGNVEALMEVMRILKANGVAWNEMIRLRSNPVARQQVLAVLRNAAVQCAPAQPQPPQ